MRHANFEICFDHRPDHDTPVYERHGTPYAVTQEEIDELQDRHKLQERKEKLISLRRATQQLVKAHADGVHLNHDQAAALDRLQGLSNLTRWGGDVAIKAFNDLDVIFFMGRLRGNIYLRWSDKKDTGASQWLGLTLFAGLIAPRITIQLSTTYLKDIRCSLRDVWSTLIHEMIHAYLFLMVGEDAVGDDIGGIPMHGPCFEACINALQSRIGSPKYIKLSLTYEGTGPKRGGYRRIHDVEVGKELLGRHRGMEEADDFDDYDDLDDYDRHRGHNRYGGGHHRRHRY